MLSASSFLCMLHSFPNENIISIYSCGLDCDSNPFDFINVGHTPPPCLNSILHLRCLIHFNIYLPLTHQIILSVNPLKVGTINLKIKVIFYWNTCGFFSIYCRSIRSQKRRIFRLIMSIIIRFQLLPECTIRELFHSISLPTFWCRFWYNLLRSLPL